ncbi:carbohydrate ABC transporter permease [Thermomicrobium sp. 4228-Ro]|uniref:carbohydrate ABC transporter permease n=1 Tax=Thermomicrobium sp. 4228-Ro TaxID=2993937 RepID=UPI00224965F6|nr:carbohydrate ABC transporter permease [Thermomicrobium sp. 4228-Ro]MCX2728416.1 carbohydrate ABC transporter permease [Thermomicrobium sp. 4228-Ro]
MTDTRRLLLRVLLVAVLAIFLTQALFPFVWMAITAFKRDSDLYNPTNNPFLFNEPPTLAHFRLLFNETKFPRWVVNTAWVGLATVLITLALSLPAGYALARLRGRFGQNLGIAVFLTYLIPPTLLFLPLSQIVSGIGLQDNTWSLVLTYPSLAVPFVSWLLMGFFRSLPQELEEAALVDGATRFTAFWRILLPLAVPGILTAVIFTFTLAVNEFIYALTFVSISDLKTVSVGVPTDLIRGDVFFWGAIMASALVVSLPVALLYNAFLDRFVEGLTAGALR